PKRDFFVVGEPNAAYGELFIDLGHPDLGDFWIPEDFILVATYHTHPTTDYANTNENNNQVAWRQAVPGIIIHENGLTAFGPPARAQIHVPAANRFFPNTNEENPKDNKYDIGQPVPGWKPDCIPNQPPPSGTSKSFKDCLKQLEDI
ncbi:hypothetical protein H0H87_002294, partial [Tephrocybe sp. NHM501043]